MAPVELLRKLEVRPFQPFRIVMSDGTSHNVTHPEAISIGLRTTSLASWASETSETISLDNLHITQLQPLSAAPIQNGRESDSQ